jgi:hypothetical protein
VPVNQFITATALPQDSQNLLAEYGPSNYDVRNLLSYYVVYDLGGSRGSAWRGLFEGLRLVSTGRFRTGQPFTINSLFDVNLDGNLTDRLDTTSGLLVTGERQRPLLLTTTDLASLRARGRERPGRAQPVSRRQRLHARRSRHQGHQARRRTVARRPRRSLQPDEPRQLRRPRPLPRSARLRPCDFDRHARPPRPVLPEVRIRVERPLTAARCRSCRPRP